MRIKTLIFAIITTICSPAYSASVIEKMVPSAQIVGEGIFTFAFWDVYNATLYAPKGKISSSYPYALSIRYMREIEGNYIADVSVSEIRKQGFRDEEKLAKWEQQMQAIFPDVADGTVLSAVFIPENKTVFYQNNQKIGEVNDPIFTHWFASIWLGENTSEPELRLKLLGLS